MSYQSFLASKALTVRPCGFDVAREAICPAAFPFQRDIIRWSLKRGRAAVFAGTGLGKTLMQLETARQVSAEMEGAPVLILAPLAVAHQTVREGQKFGIDVTLCEDSTDLAAGVNVTNYHKLDRFFTGDLGGIFLDESSILKDFEGRFRNQIIEQFRDTPYRYAYTATPAPNDFMELGNHAEFLGAMSRSEMLSMFFVHDGGQTNFWRLKGHAEGAFWAWVASWAVLLRSPEDIGYDGSAFVLPPLEMHQITVDGIPSPGWLIPVQAQTLTERRDARRATIDERVKACADVVAAEPEESWIIWCGLNSEQDMLEESFGAASFSVRGSMSPEDKEDQVMRWMAGERPIMISKPSIIGLGMNFQHCARVAFVGLSDSWESYFQAIRRAWRFGQTRPVHCYVITADTEGAVVANIERKERDATKMADALVSHTRAIVSEHIRGIERTQTLYRPEQDMQLPAWLREDAA